MKKAIALILALILVFSFTACFETDTIIPDEKSSDTDPDTTEETPDGQAKIPFDYQTQIGKNYEDVINSFETIGFTNIKTEVMYDLITGCLTKDGEVESVSIDGKTNYSKNTWYPNYVEVIITYHTFASKKPAEEREDDVQGEIPLANDYEKSIFQAIKDNSGTLTEIELGELEYENEILPTYFVTVRYKNDYLVVDAIVDALKSNILIAKPETNIYVMFLNSQNSLRYYFLIVAPIFEKANEELEKIPPELIDGEVYDSDNYSILMFPLIEKKNLNSIEVNNTYGSYTVYRNATDNEFYIDGYEQVPIGAENLITMIVDAGYTLVIERVAINPDNYEKYGLAEADNPSRYVITSVDGASHTVYIGNSVPSGGGYYCRYKDRGAVYILSASLSNTLLSPAVKLVTPVLGYQPEANNYAYTEIFTLLKNGETFVYITYEEASGEQIRVSRYKMHIPGNYEVHDNNYTSALLAVAGLKGHSVLEMGKAGESMLDDEVLMARYRFSDLQNIPYSVYYVCDGISTLISFAPSGIEGYYFAYSYLYNMIVLIESKSVEFIEWGILEYIYSGVFAKDIADVSNITVEGSYEKNSAGETVDIYESFDLAMEDQANGGTDVEVYVHTTGRKLSTDQVRQFKNFYIVILRITIKGHIQNEGFNPEDAEEIATLKVTLSDKSVLEYKFYKYSTTRSYYTINGEGEFYVLTSSVYKMLADSYNAANGKTVDQKAEHSYMD